MKIIVNDKIKYKSASFFVFIILICSSMTLFIINTGATSITSEINEKIQSPFKSSISEEDISIKSFDDQDHELENIAQESLKNIKIKDKKEPETAKGSGFFKVSDIPKIKGEIHPLLSQIVKFYFKNKTTAKKLYERGETSIEKVLTKKNYYTYMRRFEQNRIKRKRLQ